jgi:hypothetical protein
VICACQLSAVRVSLGMERGYVLQHIIASRARRRGCRSHLERSTARVLSTQSGLALRVLNPIQPRTDRSWALPDQSRVAVLRPDVYPAGFGHSLFTSLAADVSPLLGLRPGSDAHVIFSGRDVGRSVSGRTSSRF